MKMRNDNGVHSLSEFGGLGGALLALTTVLREAG
jgi:hypothetical protein